MIKTVGYKPSNKCADIAQYRHAYSILHTYSDAFACCRCMTLLQMTSDVRDVAGKKRSPKNAKSEIRTIKNRF